MSEEKRREILRQKIAEAQALGFKVESKGDFWVSMTSPAGDPIGTGGSVMAIATLGLSLLTAKSRRGRENDKNIYIEVLSNGMVETSGNSLLLSGKDYSRVPEPEGK